MRSLFFETKASSTSPSWSTARHRQWRSLYRQFGANPARAGDKNTVNRFRTECLRELKKIKVSWPELNYATAKGVLILSPSKPAIPPADPSLRLGE